MPVRDRYAVVAALPSFTGKLEEAVLECPELRSARRGLAQRGARGLASLGVRATQLFRAKLTLHEACIANCLGLGLLAATARRQQQRYEDNLT